MSFLNKIDEFIKNIVAKFQESRTHESRLKRLQEKLVREKVQSKLDVISSKRQKEKLLNQKEKIKQLKEKDKQIEAMPEMPTLFNLGGDKK